MSAISKPKYAWWSYAKHMVQRYPEGLNENERRAVEGAIAETERMPSGEDRLRVVRMVLFKGTHSVAGAALQIPCSERTAQRYHGDFLRAVGKHFSCDGLW